MIGVRIVVLKWMVKAMNDDEIFATYSVFPNYTRDMYDGNAPAGKGHEMIDGGFADRWDFKYGNAETYNGKILHASFNISSNVHIFIHYDSLWVTDFRYKCKTDFWEHCVNHCGMPGPPCVSETSRHKLEPEKLKKYLNSKFDNCKIWDMVQQRAKELCGFTCEEKIGSTK